MFKAHPVLGVGMGGYWAAIPTFHDASGTMTPQEAHNDYLELLASGGVVGFALGHLVRGGCLANERVKICARRIASGALPAFGAAIGIAGVAVHSLVDFGLHMIVNALVFTTLIVIATSKPHWGNEPSETIMTKSSHLKRAIASMLAISLGAAMAERVGATRCLGWRQRVSRTGHHGRRGHRF